MDTSTGLQAAVAPQILTTVGRHADAVPRPFAGLGVSSMPKSKHPDSRASRGSPRYTVRVSSVEQVADLLGCTVPILLGYVALGMVPSPSIVAGVPYYAAHQVAAIVRGLSFPGTYLAAVSPEIAREVARLRRRSPAPQSTGGTYRTTRAAKGGAA